MQSVSASIFNVSARKCRSPNAGLPLWCYCWPACPEAKFLCKTGAVFPSRVCWGPRFIFRGCWMSLASEGAVALSSGSYPTATRSFFYSSQGFSPSASTQPFFLFFLPQKAWLCNWLIIHFHNYAATTTVQFRTVPAPWSFSSRSFVLNPCSQQPLGNHWFAFQSHSISSLQKFHVNGIKQWVVFCVWLLSLSVLVFRFIHVCRAVVASSSVLA